MIPHSCDSSTRSFVNSSTRYFVISGLRGGVRPWLFLDVTQRRLVVTDVSGQPIGPSFKGQAVKGAVQGELELLEPRRWDRYVVPKRW
jgi:hypothetical protein